MSSPTTTPPDKTVSHRTPAASEATHPSDTLKLGVFCLLVLIWSSTWMALKIGLDYFPPLFGVAVRFSIAGPIFLILMKLRGIPIEWRRHQPLFLAVAVLSFVVSFGIVYWGTQYITSGLSAVLFSTLPIMTGLVTLGLLKEERLTGWRVGGLLVGLAGIVLINSGDLDQFHPRAPLAALVVLIAPFATAVSTVLSKKKSGEIHPFAMAGFPMTYGGIINIALWWIFERDRELIWGGPGLASLAYLTLVGSLVTFGFYYWLLRHMEVSRINLIAYLTPVFALAIGYFVGRETVSASILGGAALVLAGVALAGRKRSG